MFINFVFYQKEFVLPSFDGNINSITIRNCKELLVKSGTFQKVDYVDQINIENIQNLVLESFSLEFTKRLPVPKIKLTFLNVNCIFLTFFLNFERYFFSERY